ncbi:spermidine synthase [Massilia sp. MP_M2]|uniref:spermine/spermidine synthase domain-containing protein n=1 Tax=Massilia sp. MP_M2 TaxID=3071713 RepID=UPI00319E8FC0
MPAPDHLPAPPAVAAPLVVSDGKHRTLAFSPGDVQSEMLLAQPDALVLDYTRAMMCFALFAPRPRHIVMVGLGGGSLAKFCYRHFPHARITVLEIRADVIALRDLFCLPPDDARLRVLHCDAADYLARTPGDADVLLVDGFDRNGLPPALASGAFYAASRRALRPGGVLVANIFSYDPGYVSFLQHLRDAFDGRIMWFRRIAGNNRILFAVRPATPPSRGQRLLLRLVRRHRDRNGTGFGWSNRLLARGVVVWLERRGS